MNSRIATSFIAGILLNFTAYATSPLPKTVQAPLIDGELSDLAWQKALMIQSFKTIQPDFGLTPSEKTEAYLTYDDTHIYLGIYCHDTEPSKIKASLSARDQLSGDDWVAFCLDADDDELSAYFFLSNPLGIQVDGTLDASASPDVLLDLVWQNATQLTDDGYTVEMAIPIRNLRFSNRDSIKMGFKIARYISRKSEEVDFPEYHPEWGAALTQFEKIILTEIKSKNTLEILPAVTLAKNDYREGGKLMAGDWKSNLGITTKIGINSGLTLDATYNPDFSQIESDAGQIDVNLRAALYYPEKRPFFQEGQELFGFSANPDGSFFQQIVNTRNIVDPKAGIKLTGRIGQKNLLATLYALDEYPRSSGDQPDGENAHFSVFRYGRLLQNDSYLGAVFTGWNYAGQYNYVAGADGRIRTKKQNQLEFHGFRSFTGSLASESTGHALGANYRYESRNWNIRIGTFDISRGFETRLGYVTRNGIFTVPSLFARNVYFDKKALQRITPYYWSRQGFDHPSKLWESFNVLGVEFALPRQTEIAISSWLSNEIFAGHRFGRNALRLEARSQPVNWLGLGLEWRYGRGIYYDANDPFSGYEHQVSANIRLQPFIKLATQLSINYADFRTYHSAPPLYTVMIWRNATVFQFNKYFFLRAITEYNTYSRNLREDVLFSFTWIPGTVIYLGYGSQFNKNAWNGSGYIPGDHFQPDQRAWFFKASYLWQR